MSVTSHVLNNATNIDKAYAAMGLPNPSAAELGFLLAEDTAQNDDVVVQDIIADPNVQNIVLPVLEMFTLAFGHAPTQATLAAIISNNITVTAGQPSLNLTSIATAFIESSTFASLYNGGVNITNVNAPVSSMIVTDLFINGLGHPPSASTLAGFNGLTILQAFQAFVQSSVTSIPSVVASVDSYLTGIIDVNAGVPANAPPPPPTQSFTLTNGGDSVISGAATVGTTTPGVTVQDTGNVTINAPLSGPFGNQATLTSGDDINLQGLGNTLNATFGHSGTTAVTGVTIEGVQTWNIQNAPSIGGTSEVIILGAGANSISGLTTLNYDGGLVGSTLEVVSISTVANGFNLSVADSQGAGNGVELVFTAASFSPAGGDQINVTANTVGNVLGSTNTDFGDAFSIVAGTATGSAGFATWNVTSNNAAQINDIALGAAGSTAARTLNISDDGSSTIIWAQNGGFEWAGLTTIDALGTSGTLTVTGKEFTGGNGLLADDTSALTTVFGGTGADLFDLSAFTGPTGQLTVVGGGNAGTVVELANSVVTAGTAFAEWAGVPTLDDVASGPGPAGVGGTINMADFSGTLTVNLLSSSSGPSPTQNSDINVTNAPDGLTFNFNHTDEGGNAFSIIGTDTTGGSSNFVTIDYRNPDATGTFTSQNFDNVNVNISTSGVGTEAFYTGTAVTPGNPDILVIGNADFNSDVGQGVTFTINATHTGGSVATIDVGNVSTGSIGDDTITLLSGPISGLPLHPSYLDTGNLDITGTDNVVIGVTNADVITSTTSGTFDMTSPDDANTGGTVANWLAYDGVVVSATSAGSELQGTLGLAGTFKGFPILDAGNDSLTDTAGNSSFFGDGGSDSIAVGHDHSGTANNIFFGEFQLNDISDTMPIESGGVAADGFWNAGPSLVGTSISSIFGGANNGGTSNDVTTITGFSVGTDNLHFNVNAWSGGNTSGDLVNGASLTKIVDTSATGSTLFLGTAGITLGSGSGSTATGHVDLILDGINNQAFAGAAALASAINTTGVGNFILGHALGHGGIVDMLVAYFNGTNVNIADVEIQNTNGGGSITDTGASGVHVYASDMVSLVGVNSLASLGTTANATHIVFDHIV